MHVRSKKTPQRVPPDVVQPSALRIGRRGRFQVQVKQCHPDLRLGMSERQDVRPTTPRDTPMTTPPPIGIPRATLNAMSLPTNMWVLGIVAKSPLVPHLSCRHTMSGTSASASICLRFARLSAPPAMLPKRDGKAHCEGAPPVGPPAPWRRQTREHRLSSVWGGATATRAQPPPTLWPRRPRRRPTSLTRAR